MSAEKRPKQTTEVDGQVWLYVQVIPGDPETAAFYRRLGIAKLLAIGPEGEMVDRQGNAHHAFARVKTTPYSIALGNIQAAEDSKDVPRGSHQAALELVRYDQFDGSGWAARYLPRQQEE